MARLEELTRGASVKGVLPDGLVTVVDVQWHGSEVVELIYRDAAGKLGTLSGKAPLMIHAEASARIDLTAFVEALNLLLQGLQTKHALVLHRIG